MAQGCLGLSGIPVMLNGLAAYAVVAGHMKHILQPLVDGPSLNPAHTLTLKFAQQYVRRWPGTRAVARARGGRARRRRVLHYYPHTS